MADRGDDEDELQFEDDYDEEADSDFEGDNVDDEIVSESSEEEQSQLVPTPRPKKRQRGAQPPSVDANLDEKDSGDEEIIGEHKRQLEKRKQKQKHKQTTEEQPANDPSDDEEQGWRARTRAMREREKEEKKTSKLATTKGATIDVDRIWEEMNRPPRTAGSNSRVLLGVDDEFTTVKAAPGAISTESVPLEAAENQAPLSQPESEEMVIVQESYMFAGQMMTRDVKVPKSTLSGPQVVSKTSSHVLELLVNGKEVQRPLRRISRFDPNGNNDAFKKTWAKAAKLKKVNVLTKTAGDWEDHVEAMGDRDALDEHAKSKGGYLSRQDFLQSVEQRKEEEARLARLKQ